MVSQLLFFFLGLFLLIIGSNYLLKYSVELSLKYNISKVVIGLTFVSFATSAPELLISISSAIKNSSDIAISNVIGSNIANIGLVFSTVLLFVSIKISKNNISYDFPWLIVVSLILLFFIQDLRISRIEGLFFIFLLTGFIYFMFSLRKPDQEKIEPAKNDISIFKIIILLIISSAVLFFGSELFVNSAIFFADFFQVSERIIGLTLVAIGTSLPELVTSLVAIYKKELDISVGNIIGSNIFNILAVLGFTATIIDLNVTSIQIIDYDIYIMIAFSLMLGFFFFVPKKFTLYRLHGIILLLLFITYYYTIL
ncbi:MAG: calcium/sodium antiporter [Flavobacteriaceae bacterium]|nr:calcium/sodium antiporter [Flavobacteriaceae bacterium]MBL6684110.1 calcium/sodium antiporter [Flavobacteriaceae bacterium]